MNRSSLFTLPDAEEQRIEMVLDLTRRLQLLEELMLAAQAQRRSVPDDLASFASNFKSVQ